MFIFLLSFLSLLHWLPSLVKSSQYRTILIFVAANFAVPTLWTAVRASEVMMSCRSATKVVQVNTRGGFPASRFAMVLILSRNPQDLRFST